MNYVGSNMFLLQYPGDFPPKMMNLTQQMMDFI